MDKLYAIKIRQSDGTYGAAIPVSVLAENVDWNSTLNLVDILGLVDTSTSIQDQINNLKNTKATQASVNALDQKVDNAVEYITHNSEIANAREGADGTEYNTLKQRLDNEYENLNNIKIQKFDTVTQMKADTSLIDGMHVQTSGYYVVNDGGSALYKIVNIQPSEYYEILNNGLYAELIFNNYVTPEQFGAYGDGITDDTVAIQSAINSGYSIYFTAKKYLISQSLLLNKDNCSIISNYNSKIARIQTTDVETTYNMFTITSQNVTIEGINIIGNEYHHSSAGNALNDGRTNIYINLGANIKIKNCIFSKIGSNGIYAYLSDNINILNCEFSKETGVDGDGYSRGVFFYKCKNTIVSKCFFHDIDDGLGGNGTYNDNSEYVNHMWANNIFERMYEHAIYGNLSQQIITSNTIKYSYNSAIKIRSVGSIIIGNTISTINTGISLSEPSRNCIVAENNIIIHDNVDTVNTITGIGISASNLQYVLQNYLGCNLTDRMTGNKINNNTINFINITSSVGNIQGISLMSSSDYTAQNDAAIQNTIIDNNTILNALTGILFMYNTDYTVIKSNIIKGANITLAFSNKRYGHGISFYIGTQYNTYIYDNIIQYFYNGVYRTIGSAVYNYFRANDFLNNNNYAFYITADCLSTAMVITENRLLGNTNDFYADSIIAFYNNSQNDVHGLPGFIVRRGAAPTSGTWRRGDIVQNISPTADSAFFWICTKAGTPGTWVELK